MADARRRGAQAQEVNTRRVTRSQTTPRPTLSERLEHIRPIDRIPLANLLMLQDLAWSEDTDENQRYISIRPLNNMYELVNIIGDSFEDYSDSDSDDSDYGAKKAVSKRDLHRLKKVRVTRRLLCELADKPYRREKRRKLMESSNAEGNLAASEEESPLEAKPLEESDPNAPSCPICLTPYKIGELIVELPCTHKFCSECTTAWLNQNRLCPLCRKQVRKVAYPDTPQNSTHTMITRYRAALAEANEENSKQ